MLDDGIGLVDDGGSSPLNLPRTKLTHLLEDVVPIKQQVKSPYKGNCCFAP